MTINNKFQLKTSKNGEEYAKILDKLHDEVSSIPHFNDKEVMLEDSGISFFHKETQKEITWTIAVCLQKFQEINQEKVSHVLKNNELKILAEATEARLEGKDMVLISKDIFGLNNLVISDSEEE